MPKTWLLVPIVVVIALGLGRLNSHEPGPTTVEAAVLGSTPANEVDVDQLDPPMVAPRGTAAHQLTTVGAALDTFWGLRSSEARAEAERLGIDLEEESTLVPWDEVADKALTHFQMGDEEKSTLTTNYLEWKEVLDEEGLKSRFPGGDLSKYDDSLVLAVHQMAENWNARISPEVDSLVSAIERAKLDAFTQGRFRRGPLFLLKDQNPREGQLLYGAASSAGGWAFAFSIYAEDYPDIPAQKRRVRALCKQRDRELREWVHSQ